MTLAKKHIQRLWFRNPGAVVLFRPVLNIVYLRKYLTDLMPEEFWRRAKEEVPDTLLLAEAFWLMEGFFVRTLGMHRVYNSAFMNMRDEENAKLGRLSRTHLNSIQIFSNDMFNFMNNPDEKTALSNLAVKSRNILVSAPSCPPGLPMFGHGQLEGYTEKYGMEYRKAYLDENVDEGLLAHHWKAIFRC